MADVESAATGAVLSGGASIHAFQLQRGVQFPWKRVRVGHDLSCRVRFQHHVSSGTLPLQVASFQAEMHGARRVRCVAHRHDEPAEATEVGLAFHKVHAHARPAGFHAGRHAEGAIRERGDGGIALRAHYGVWTGPQRFGPRTHRGGGAREQTGNLFHLVHPIASFCQFRPSIISQPRFACGDRP